VDGDHWGHHTLGELTRRFGVAIGADIAPQLRRSDGGRAASRAGAHGSATSDTAGVKLRVGLASAPRISTRMI
jgi:hypothetical protein